MIERIKDNNNLGDLDTEESKIKRTNNLVHNKIPEEVERKSKDRFETN